MSLVHSLKKHQACYTQTSYMNSSKNIKTFFWFWAFLCSLILDFVFPSLKNSDRSAYIKTCASCMTAFYSLHFLIQILWGEDTLHPCSTDVSVSSSASLHILPCYNSLLLPSDLCSTQPSHFLSQFLLSLPLSFQCITHRSLWFSSDCILTFPSVISYLSTVISHGFFFNIK